MKLIYVNEENYGNLTNDNFRHIYKVYLEKDKKYFISVQSKNDSEFNLRLYDINKNIIRFKYDNHDENIFIADIKNNIEYAELINSDNEEDEDEEKYINLFNDNDQIYNKSSEYLKSSLYFNDDDTIHKSLSDALLNYSSKISKKNVLESSNLESSNSDILINYNNKLYFSPEECDFYILSVSSDYVNYEGEYQLQVKEVEDITKSNSSQIKVNENVNILLKNKFDSKNFTINLIKDKSYEIIVPHNLKVLIIKDSQKIISSSNNIFNAEFNGEYEIEIISLENDINNKFKIKELNFKETEMSNIISADKFVLKDENGNDFELYIKDKKLKIKPV